MCIRGSVSLLGSLGRRACVQSFGPVESIKNTRCLCHGDFVTVLTPRLARSGGTFLEHACWMSGSPEAWKLPGRSSLSVAPVFEAHALYLSSVMAASRGHGPGHDPPALPLPAPPAARLPAEPARSPRRTQHPPQRNPAAHAAQHIIGAHDETTTDAIGIY